MYRIKHEHLTDDETGEPLYWSDIDGWVDRASATRYTEWERYRPQYLPLGSVWEKQGGDIDISTSRTYKR